MVNDNPLTLSTSEPDDQLAVFVQGPAINLYNHQPSVVLVLRPDGTKLRGSDNKPVTELDKQELLELIDDLCACMGAPRK